tara:strand:+ start:1438 stop:1578 length:141 start_codon:yes stop_codon:yes gene_type:complete
LLLLLLPLPLLLLVPFTTMVERTTPLVVLRAAPCAPEVAGAIAPLA